MWETLAQSNMVQPASQTELRMKGGSSCSCCPYGYHIDKDFVRYCESLYNSSQLDKLKLQKKERRKMKMSIESYLGLNDTPKKGEDSVIPVLKVPLHSSSSFAHLTSDDGLKDAVQDFEDTWQKSLTRNVSNFRQCEAEKECNYLRNNESNFCDSLLSSKSTLPSKVQNYSKNYSQNKTVHSSPAFSHSLSSSSSSISSHSTSVSSIGVQVLLPPDSTNGISVSQQIAATMASLSSAESRKVLHDTVGIPRSTLTCIREQMALSLNHMKELEEKVKSIPVLQVRLSVLKEENRQLLTNLKSQLGGSLDTMIGDIIVEEDLEKQIKRLDNHGILTPRMTRKFTTDATSLKSSSEDLSSPAIAASLNNLLVEKCVNNLEKTSHLSKNNNLSINGTILKKSEGKNFKNVGILCSVLTRDIGTGHIPCKKRSIGIGDENINSNIYCFHCKQQNCMKQSPSVSSESLESDSDSIDERVLWSYDSSERSCQKRTTSSKVALVSNNHVKPGVFPFVHHEKSSEFPLSTANNSYPVPQKISEMVSIGVNTDSLSFKFGQTAEVTTKTDVLCQSVSTNTDFTCVDIMNMEDFNARKVSKGIDKMTICELPVKHSFGVQVSPIFCNQNVGTICDLKLFSHASAQTSEQCDQNAFENTARTNVGFKKFGSQTIYGHDIGVGDCDISELTCMICNDKQRQNVGVGDFSVEDVICDKCCHKKTVSVGCGEFSVTSTICDECGQLRMKELSGDICKDEKELDIHGKYVKSIISCSVGINTTESSFSTSNRVNKTGISICDKCSETIHSVAQDFVIRNNEVDTAETVSRIPRLNLQTTVSLTKKAKSLKVKPLTGATEKYLKNSVSQTKHSSIEITNNFSTNSDVKNSNTGSIDLNKPDIKSSCSLEKAKMISSSEESDNDSFEDESFSRDSAQHCSSETITLDPLLTIPHKRVHLSKEVSAACKVLNDYLQKPERGTEKKILSSLSIVQNEWFQVANQKNANPHVIEDYLDAFEEFSKLLLHRIVNLSDNNGNTAIHYAVSYGNFDVVSILIDSKVCDVNKQNKAGYTCIMLVALAEVKNDTHHYVIHRLFQMGDINIKATQNGQTALMLAVSHGKKDAVKVLLDAGAEVNLQDNDGSTALMCAAEHGHLDIVKLLLLNPDCDPTIVDADGSNALAIAMEADHKDIGVLIYAHMNFSRGSSPYSSLKQLRRSTPRSSPSPRTPTMRTPPPPSPSSWSTSSIPSTFHFSS